MFQRLPTNPNRELELPGFDGVPAINKVVFGIVMPEKGRAEIMCLTSGTWILIRSKPSLYRSGSVRKASLYIVGFDSRIVRVDG